MNDRYYVVKKLLEEQKSENFTDNSSYCVGDCVYIRNDIKQNTICYSNKYGYRVYIVDDMLHLRGELVQITLAADDGTYRIDSDDGVYVWTSDMFSNMNNTYIYEE